MDEHRTPYSFLLEMLNRRTRWDRRSVARGGRRASDDLFCPNPPCKGCGSLSGLRWVSGSKSFDRYLCHVCGASISVARADG
jgi:hypothetical protein